MSTSKKCCRQHSVSTSNRYDVLSDSDQSEQLETGNRLLGSHSYVDAANFKQRKKTKINDEQRPSYKGKNVSVIIGELIIKELHDCEMSSEE